MNKTHDLSQSQLRQLCEAMGWQGGTFWQVLNEVKRLKAAPVSGVTTCATPSSEPPVPYCAQDGTCSCAKFAADPTNCERRLERNAGVTGGANG